MCGHRIQSLKIENVGRLFHLTPLTPAYNARIQSLLLTVESDVSQACNKHNTIQILNKTPGLKFLNLLL